MNKKQKLNIGIIGGGVSGVSCALRLCELGHQVTILEASDYIGGKCTSVMIDGKHFDVGGVAGIGGLYDVVKKISDSVDLDIEYVSNMETISLTNGNKIFIPKGVIKKIKLVWQAIKYMILFYYFGGNKKAGLYDFDRRLLNISWEDFSKKYKLEILESLTRIPLYGFGYGESQNITMAYIFNYITPSTMIRELFSFLPFAGLYYWKKGTQEIWKRVSDKIAKEYSAKILINNKVKKVTRLKNEVNVQCENGLDYVFDRIVISTDANVTKQFLDVTLKENMLLGLVEFNDYRVYLCEIDNFNEHKNKEVVRVWENCKNYIYNEPAVWDKMYEELNYYVVYVPVYNATDEQIVDNMKNYFTQLGGEFKGVKRVFKWNMFPHVKANKAEEFIKGMWELQGKNNTYYIGEVFSFSLMPSLVKHSFDVADKIK